MHNHKQKRHKKPIKPLVVISAIKMQSILSVWAVSPTESDFMAPSLYGLSIDEEIR